MRQSLLCLSKQALTLHFELFFKGPIALVSDMSETIRPTDTVGAGFAIAHIKATQNNILVSITNSQGDTLCWASAGTCGFKGSRKSSPFAALCAAQKAGEQAAKLGVKEVEVRLKGNGAGLDAAINGLVSAGLTLKHGGLPCA
jgi:small subunit ribosomal protein S11